MENVIIVGSGPAGYTAALYCARANLRPLVIEGFVWGGLLQQTTDVENYPGFPDGIQGPELMANMRAQAERFGARFITDEATEVALRAHGVHTVSVGEDAYRAPVVIVATGSVPRKLGVPGEEELAGRGVSYCATCDAAFFAGKRVLVAGGGDTALEEAIFLAKFASDVTLVHRREEFRASKIMVDRARRVENLQVLTPFTIDALVSRDENGPLRAARLRHAGTGEERVVDVDGCFVAVGHEPQSQLVAGQLELDTAGYVRVDGRSTRTNRPGVFACGDLIDPEYRQAVTAAASGCQAALDCERYLRDLGLDRA